MVSIQDIEKRLKLYGIDIHKESSEKSKGTKVSFLSITDGSKLWLIVHVQFINDQLHAVKFYNNDFFEIDDALLLDVLDSILEGRYKIGKSGIFSRRKRIIIHLDGGKTVSPERVYDDAKLDGVYDRLPTSFTKLK